MSLGIGKQRELPRRPGDWRTAKGDMNKVPEHALEEAEEMRRRHEQAPTPPSRPEES